ncbi:hypothetical protein EYR36_002399 [Pleurotus pulmonarius]|nr:hypothetical protein EYR36_002399 [Pleurotus pulmonarius]
MDDKTRKPTNVLDVEDDDARQRRIQLALEKLNQSSATAPAVSPFSFSNAKDYKFSPANELISRVQAFLPQLEVSNSLLAKKMQEDPGSVDIENITEGESQYIEMNLGLGVFEQRNKNQEMDVDVDDSESSSYSSTSTTSSSGSSASDDTTSDIDYDSDASSEIITCFVPSRPIRPLPKRKPRPQIVVLGD